MNSPVLWNLYNTCDPPLCSRLEPAVCPSSTNRLKPPVKQYQEKVAAFEISPNPSTGNISIDNLTKGDVIMVYSVLGDVLQTFISGETSVQISLADLEPGIYIVSLNNSIQRKVVKL